MKLSIALYFAGTKAASADVDTFYFAVYDSAYSLDCLLYTSKGDVTAASPGNS